MVVLAPGDVSDSGWSCSECGAPVSEDALNAPRTACPQCGSTARTAHVSISVEATARVYLKTHSKHRYGGRKVVRELIEGDDYFRKTGQWTVMRRLVDRVNNWYEEIFRDPETRAIIHEKGELLTEHRPPSKTK